MKYLSEGALDMVCMCMIFWHLTGAKEWRQEEKVDPGTHSTEGLTAGTTTGTSGGPDRTQVAGWTGGGCRGELWQRSHLQQLPGARTFTTASEEPL